MDALKLYRVHSQDVWLDDESKKLYFLDVKGAFLGFEVQVILAQSL